MRGLDVVLKKRGISRAELAEHLGVEESTLSRYVTGKIKRIPLDCITETARFLCSTPNEIMGYDAKGLSELDIEEKPTKANAFKSVILAAVQAGKEAKEALESISLDVIGGDLRKEDLQRVSKESREASIAMGTLAEKADFAVASLSG